MPAVELGLFDIQQIDPLVHASDQEVYTARLDDLSLADELGFTVAFVAERHYLTTYRCQASSVWLGAATQRTRSLRLGVLAHTLPITPPLRLAEEIATLDQISGGRIEVGLGLGHRVEELIANGVDPNERIAIFQERLGIMEGLWAGGTVTYASSHTVVKEARINPLPIQRPHPPIWFAGTDSTAAMWAGQHGLNLAVGFAPSDAIFGATAAFRHGVGIRKTRTSEDDGVRRGQIALMRQVYLAETDAQARTEVIEDLLRLTELGSPSTEENRADRKAQATEQFERITGEEIVVAGGPESVARTIMDARNKLGASLFLANVYAAGVPTERVRRTMRLLAGPVRDGLDTLATRII
jgi:alkanesulfonate monooxygenase SsuD/methylene tetrahydromethanopterin reductase-like flavin-dependent oxidoreductase (luciferase family)